MKPLIITSSITLALAVLLFFSFYQIQGENREAEELKQEVLRRGAEEELLQKVKILKNTGESELEIFDKLELNKDTIVPMIERLESASRSLGLDSEISAADEVEGGFRLSLESEGAWRGIFSYLKAIESLPYRVDFEKLALSKSGSDWRLVTVIFLPK